MNRNICKICGQDLSEFKRPASHFNSKGHPGSSLKYIQEYLDIDIVYKYNVQKKSAKTITDEIRREISWVNPTKKTMLTFLNNHEKINVRNTSEAIEVWIKNSGGVWNEGLTKEESSAILSQSKQMTGTQNPYFDITQEKLDETVHYWKWKSDKELNKIREKASQNHPHKNPYRNLSKERREKLKKKRVEGYYSWLEKNNGFPDEDRFISSLEEKIKDCLLEENYNEFEQQVFYRVKSTEKIFSYDFRIKVNKQLHILEINGDYYHCNPQKYNKDYFNERLEKFSEEIWKKDRIKRNEALKNDKMCDWYTAIWESEIKNKTNKEIKELLNEILQNKKYSKKEPKEEGIRYPSQN